MYMRTQHNINTLITWVESCPHLRFSSRAPSPTTPCVIVKPFEHLSVEDHFAVLRSISKKMEHAGLAFDIVNHAFAFPAFRLWCGPTVEAADIEALLPPLIKEIEERIS
jgi:phosphoserine aminotransferase